MTSSSTAFSSLFVILSFGCSSGRVCFSSNCRHLKIEAVRGTNVAIPLGVGNFIIACVVDGMARSSLIPVRPKMILYGDNACTTMNFIIVLRHNPSLLNITSSLILPIRSN
ncbi:hypothetical protein Tco_1171343, partial [Tanacetum coccineum]